MDFYNRLNYSLGNEDWSVENQALRIRSGDKAICVTASGDRPLHLLMTDCSEIISIDMNRIQTFLLELKIAAMTRLDYDKYLEFLGCEPTKHRYDIFKTLKNELSTDAAHFWEQHKKMIDRGILYEGRVERLTYYFAKCISLFRSQAINTLFSFTDLESQKKHVLSAWDTKWWRRFFDVVLNPNFMKYILNDPGMVSYVDSSINPGKFIYQRMINHLNHHLARNSPLVQMIFKGKIIEDAYLPYLTYPGYKKIRSDISRLTYHTCNIIEYIRNSEPNSFNCFSMSDIASYMTQDDFEGLLLAIRNAAKPQARFCVRKLMSSHFIPSSLTSNFRRDFLLEKKLEHEEKNFVYRFFVGEVIK